LLNNLRLRWVSCGGKGCDRYLCLTGLTLTEPVAPLPDAGKPVESLSHCTRQCTSSRINVDFKLGLTQFPYRLIQQRFWRQVAISAVVAPATVEFAIAGEMTVHYVIGQLVGCVIPVLDFPSAPLGAEHQR